MNWSLLIAFVPVIVALANKWETVDPMKTLQQGYELLEKIPEEDPARAKLAEYLAQEIESLQPITRLSRDPAGSAIGATSLVGAVLLGRWVPGHHLGWWIGVAVLALIGVVGLATSLPRKQRDAKGNVIAS